MVTKEQLESSTVLTPVQLEEKKNSQQKAEDVIYTFNHALTCLSITDLFVMPAVNGVMQTLLGDKAPRLGCAGHDHGHGHHHAEPEPHGHVHGPNCGHDNAHAHAHPTAKPSPWNELKAPWRNLRNWFKSEEPVSQKLKSLLGNSKNWLISEAAGDLGAVVPTIAMQRFAPSAMNGIRSMLEPAVGGWFKRGAEKAAHQWADKHGLARDSEECVNRAKELYDYEIRHLPQMAIWTLSSIGISWGSMKYLAPEMTVGEFARTKIVGAGVTAGLVVGARAYSPNAAHSWDQTISKHIIVPTTKILGKPFGVESKDVDQFVKKRNDEDAPELKGRVSAAQPAEALSA